MVRNLKTAVTDWLMSCGFVKSKRMRQAVWNPLWRKWQMWDGCFHIEVFYFKVLPSWLGTVINMLSPLHCTAAFMHFVFLPKLLWDTNRQDSHSFQQLKKRGTWKVHNNDIVWSLEKLGQKPVNQTNHWKGMTKKRNKKQKRLYLWFRPEHQHNILLHMATWHVVDTQSFSGLLNLSHCNLCCIKIPSKWWN